MALLHNYAIQMEITGRVVDEVQLAVLQIELRTTGGFCGNVESEEFAATLDRCSAPNGADGPTRVRGARPCFTA